MADADRRATDDPGGEGLPADARREIAAFLRDWLADEGLPGVSVAVVRGDDVVYADGFGSRDLAGDRPATGDTLYGVGSVTKSFAALAVTQLSEAGDLDVADPASEYLDAATDALAADLPEGITLHHLLTHSSGVPSLGTSEALIARRLDLAELGVPLGDREDFHAHVAGGLDERRGDPGEHVMYCNSGYSLLGEVVETVSGRSFAEYVEAEILDPLGMDRSTFDGGAYEADGDAATPYLLDVPGGDEDVAGGGDGDGGSATPEPTDLPVRELSAAPGGLASSARELGRYVACQRNGGALDGARLASQSAFDRMHEGHVETDSGPYGYGWRRRELEAGAGTTVVGHSGSIAVSTAYAGFTPDDEWGVAVCCNAAPDYALRAVGEAVLTALLGGDPGDAPVFARRDRLDRLTGTYESYRGIRTAEVTREGETLRLAFTDALGGEPSSLVPEDDAVPVEDGSAAFYRLAADGGRQSVEFEVGEDCVDLFVDRWRLHRVD